MADEEVKEEKSTEGDIKTPDGKDTGDKGDILPEEKSNTTIDRANAAAQRMEDATAKLEKVLAQQQAQKVEETIGGTAEAGQPAKTEDEKNIEASKKMLEGTGYEDVLDAPPKEPAKFTKN